MNEYAMGAIPDPTRARIRIQIKRTIQEELSGKRDEILIVQGYSIMKHGNTFVLIYDDRNGNRGRRTFASGTYFETKLMG
jgi:hypothetical protein